MTVDISLRATSLQLYHFLCKHIVGTEETVRMKRLMNNISDNIISDDKNVNITSGSCGEGLELKGSDLDLMNVLKSIIVHENTQNVKLVPEKINLIMETNNTKPGFTELRCLHFSEGLEKFTQMFEQRGNSWYLSSKMFKLFFLNERHKEWGECLNIHGPCLSDKNENIDMAYCLHNPHWIQPADNWISRGHTSWPSRDVKSDIIDHGVLFVPIGSKGSDHEALEWRVSFSVAEKLLIYSFSHTQLLCYALFKILLKDLINSNINCKNLLCSYFIKTIIFWVSEEIPETEWKPENLAQCFVRCFRRLLYFVEFSMCPHYFIPMNNLFENKIDGQPQQLLLGHLNTLFSFGWRCVIFSEQLKDFSIYSSALPGSSELKGIQLELILISFTSVVTSGSIDQKPLWLRYKRCIRILNVNKSSVIKLACMRNLSSICSAIQQSIVSPSDINKRIYFHRRTQLAYLLQNIHHDAMSGWIMLTAFFYKTKHYRNALYILSYAMKKCTPEKVYYKDRLSLSQLQQNLTKSTTLQRLGILRVLNLVTMAPVLLFRSSTLMPEELALNLEHSYFCPDVFGEFLSFLCHYHLNDTQRCYTSIRNIQLMIREYFFIDSYQTGLSYILLGVALQKVGQKDLAIRAFTNSNQCDPSLKTTAAKRLSMINTS